ncbi:hypothetical protein HJC99_05895 [Candidatus Saccharibacteria bacterium]|nr:hypothetical protein [Candidatus Saccharibacteria bacterium]
MQKTPVVSAVSTDGLPAGVKILPVDGEEAPKTTKKAKLGRPKAGRLDVPAAATKRIVGEVTGPPPSQTPPPLPKPIHDIAPPPPKPIREPDNRPLPPVIRRASVAYSEILGASIAGRFTHHRSFMTIVPAALVAMVATVAGVVLASGQPHRLVSATVDAGWAVGGELIIIAVIYYLVRSLSHAAITFGSARLSDHRPLPTERWLEVAADSQGRRLGIDVLASLGLLVMLALMAGLFVSGSHLSGLPEVAQIAILMLGFGVLLYASVAITMTVSLGHIAVTLAQVHTVSGLKLGWRLFRRHFELAGARLTALSLETLGLIAVLVGAGGWLIVSPANLRPLVIGAVGVVLAAIGALAGAGTAIWWGNAYRALVQVDHPAGFHRLLSTAVPKAARVTPVIVISGVLLGLSALAVAWPWLVN